MEEKCKMNEKEAATIMYKVIQAIEHIHS